MAFPVSCSKNSLELYIVMHCENLVPVQKSQTWQQKINDQLFFTKDIFKAFGLKHIEINIEWMGIVKIYQYTKCLFFL